MGLASRLWIIKKRLKEIGSVVSLRSRRVITGRSPRRLLFEHVPKCGGTSVKEFLKSQYLPQRVFEIDGMNVDNSLKHWIQLEESSRHRFDLLLGHGAHKLRELFHQDAVRVTVLRDPVERIVSHYYFVRNSPNHYLHKQLMSSQMTLAEYATSDLSPELRNNYVRRFTGIPAEQAEQAPSDAIAEAVNVLQNLYHVVGFTEDLDDAMHAISEVCKFHWRWAPERRNVNAERPTSVDEGVLNLIRNRNALDVELYEKMRSRCLSGQSCVMNLDARRNESVSGPKSEPS